MKTSYKLPWTVIAAWLVFPAFFLAVALGMPAGATRTAFGNVLLCLLPLFVNGALLSNATTRHGRINAFWMLLAFGCTLWLSGQFIWMYVEVYKQQPIPVPFITDLIFFLHTVPMIAALTMQPHKRPITQIARFAQVDLALISVWWIYLYVFAVLPWQYAITDNLNYGQASRIISFFENLVFVVVAALLATKETGRWRRIYAYLAGAGGVYTAGLFVLEFLLTMKAYSRVTLYTMPVILSFLFLGMAGVSAFRSTSEENEDDLPAVKPATTVQNMGESPWASRMARSALLSLPVIAFWSLEANPTPMAVHKFRILISLGAVLPLGFLAFLRHELVDAERLRLLRSSQEAFDNLKRLQMHFVQSEKLASIGQLVAGAAHEINNPLTAILGYSELLSDDAAVDSRSRSIAQKIREQALRTKTLVNHLLSFARQTPSEQRSQLDINTILNTAVQFRRIDLRGKNINFEIHAGTSIPEVRGDANHILQVFCNIINNAVDAMQEVGGGTLTVRTFVEKGNVVIVFSDTGKGIRDPHLVFDPFYTTKPVGQGTGLGLSICYGLVHDQGGNISCLNRPEGGATFRVELPAIPTLFTQWTGTSNPQDKSAKLA